MQQYSRLPQIQCSAKQLNIYIKSQNKQKQSMLLEVRIVVITEDAGGHWKLCVRGFAGTVNILISNLGACDIGSYDLCTFLYAYYTSKQNCYSIYVKKNQVSQHISSVHVSRIHFC